MKKLSIVGILIGAALLTSALKFSWAHVGHME
jgi:hypothetical protein